MKNRMSKRVLPVYAKDRVTVLAEVSTRMQSAGAAKLARVGSCHFGFINNSPCWIEKELAR